MIHSLCLECMHACKQDENVDIVKCANFQKRISEDEFRDLIDSLEEMESKAAELRKRTRSLIETAVKRASEPVGECAEDDDGDLGDDD